MERDLDDVVAASLGEREARLSTAAPDPRALAATIAGVRRRHRRRRTGETFAAVGAAAALVVMIGIGGEHGGPGPAQTPTPSVAPSPTHAPTSPPTTSPSPDPTPSTPSLPTQADIDAGLGLPATVPAPKGIWGQTGEGWALGIYRPSMTLDDSTAVVRSTLVLAAPDGTAFRVVELPKDKDVELVRWTPGETKALVTIAPVQDGDSGPGVRGWLDLRTGKLSEDRGAVGERDDTGEAPEPVFLGTDHRGDEIWFVTYGESAGGGPSSIVVEKPDGTKVRRIGLHGALTFGGPPMLDPSGHRLVMPGHDDGEATFDTVDLDTGKQTAHSYDAGSLACLVVGWRSADEVLTRCRQEPWQATGYALKVLTGHDPLYVVNLDGRPPRTSWTLKDGDPAVPLWESITLPDGRIVVGTRPVGSDDDDSCTAGLYVLDDDHGTPLGVDHLFSARPSGTVGTTIYSLTSLGCATSDVSGQQLESLDGTTRTPLLRPPAPTTAAIEGGLETWVVAGGPSGRV